jgi:hypothetical protein
MDGKMPWVPPNEGNPYPSEETASDDEDDAFDENGADEDSTADDDEIPEDDGAADDDDGPDEEYTCDDDTGSEETKADEDDDSGEVGIELTGGRPVGRCSVYEPLLAANELDV